ncbi:response regulator [Pararhodospirillum photometricum]|uniref:Response regulator receiver domain protein (CheY) n=1 Tax=Pararhodospirillum photometricum DSM 122 TaxID=1150469 RepID=H6SRU3_PARPM|nr:response regulator [Pararhodospirillum photometricum]CCG07622.1 Response regulator receiver domain protein (CheY) [Pararhodospirillum photometricum DSM 122]
MARDDYNALIEAEFREELRDNISELEVTVGNLRSAAVPLRQGATRVRSIVARINRLSVAMDFSLLSLTLRRFTDYMHDLDEPTDRNLDDLAIFADILSGLLVGEIDAAANEAEFFRSLPARRPVDLGDVEHLNVEVLLVEPQRSSANIIARELHQCGYKVTNARTAREGLDLAARTRPDLVISSAVLDILSGVDLGCALAAMPSTESIAFCILTSFDRDHPFLVKLPKSCGYLHKGGNFGVDLSNELQRFGLM